MRPLMRSTFLTSLLVTVFVTCAAECVDAQDGLPKPDAAENAQVLQLIRDLGSSSFATQLKASKLLQSAGDAAIQPLEVSIKGATGESRLRMQSILNELKRNSFAGRLAALEKSASVEAAVGLPE